MKKPLSKNESKVWEYLLKFLEDYEVMPTYSQIAYDMGWSRSYCHRLVQSMEEKGWVKTKKQKAGITLKT